jgi:protein SCO1/2
VAIYEARGVVRQLDPQQNQATIAHEAIPGYMPAMTMAFKVRDPREFTGLRAGDLVAFHLCVTSHDAWVEQVQKIGVTPISLVPEPPSPGRELRPGDLLPDIALTNQHGEKIRLSDFRGQVVAITFIYTRCPLPTYCPLITRNFQAAQGLLAQIGAGDNWHLLSITLDPGHDTPEVLATAAENQEADEKHWTFATSDGGTVADFGRLVGLEYTVSADGQISHNLRTVLIDSSGRMVHIFKGNSWTPQELVSEMRHVLQNRQ